ncbi:hypothetical protein LSTR_LSTR016110, partial [Laodelphax striatellus]
AFIVFFILALAGLVVADHHANSYQSIHNKHHKFEYHINHGGKHGKHGYWHGKSHPHGYGGF